MSLAQSQFGVSTQPDTIIISFGQYSLKYGNLPCRHTPYLPSQGVLNLVSFPFSYVQFAWPICYFSMDFCKKYFIAFYSPNIRWKSTSSLPYNSCLSVNTFGKLITYWIWYHFILIRKGSLNFWTLCKYFFTAQYNLLCHSWIEGVPSYPK